MPGQRGESLRLQRVNKPVVADEPGGDDLPPSRRPSDEAIGRLRLARPTWPASSVKIARTRRTATSVSSRRIDRVTDCTPLPAVRLVGSCLRPVAMLVLSVV
jgi:hypothetical protein